MAALLRPENWPSPKAHRVLVERQDLARRYRLDGLVLKRDPQQRPIFIPRAAMLLRLLVASTPVASSSWHHSLFAAAVAADAHPSAGRV